MKNRMALTHRNSVFCDKKSNKTPKMFIYFALCIFVLSLVSCAKYTRADYSLNSIEVSPANIDYDLSFERAVYNYFGSKHNLDDQSENIENLLDVRLIHVTQKSLVRSSQYNVDVAEILATVEVTNISSGKSATGTGRSSFKTESSATLEQSTAANKTKTAAAEKSFELAIDRAILNLK